MRTKTRAKQVRRLALPSNGVANLDDRLWRELRPALEDCLADAGGVDAGFAQQLFAAGMLEKGVRQTELQQRDLQIFPGGFAAR